MESLASKAIKYRGTFLRIGGVNGVRVIDASDTSWGIINHDLFLSNEEVQRVIRRSIDAAAT